MEKAQVLSAVTVAEYFLEKARQGEKSITNKKIQKLAYYAQAWSLALNHRKLFEEKIEAWVHGPVVREIYNEFKHFGFLDIQKTIDENLIKTISEENKTLLDEVWRIYGKFDSQYLEMLTHSETPWQAARAGLDASENSEVEINTDLMKDFYSKKLISLA